MHVLSLRAEDGWRREIWFRAINRCLDKDIEVRVRDNVVKRVPHRHPDADGIAGHEDAIRNERHQAPVVQPVP
eukprot:scaffold209841_cov43-Prasinocladus_malaysianus.AAC.1